MLDRDPMHARAYQFGYILSEEQEEEEEEGGEEGGGNTRRWRGEDEGKSGKGGEGKGR